MVWKALALSVGAHIVVFTVLPSLRESHTSTITIETITVPAPEPPKAAPGSASESESESESGSGSGSGSATASVSEHRGSRNRASSSSSSSSSDSSRVQDQGGTVITEKPKIGLGMRPPEFKSRVMEEAGSFRPEARSPLALPEGVPRPEKPDMVDNGGGRKRKDDLAFVANVERDGSIRFHDRPNVHGLQGAGIGFSFTFDLTDWAMRSHNMDPYDARKRKWMEETREERARMSEAEQTELLRDAVDRLPKTLARIWAYDKWSEAQRRRAFFDLWDECAEEGTPEVLTIAGEVRVTIVAFIRERLPHGSAAAYTREELEALNRDRQSQARFAPYDD